MRMAAPHRLGFTDEQVVQHAAARAAQAHGVHEVARGRRRRPVPGREGRPPARPRCRRARNPSTTCTGANRLSASARRRRSSGTRARRPDSRISRGASSRISLGGDALGHVLEQRGQGDVRTGVARQPRRRAPPASSPGRRRSTPLRRSRGRLWGSPCSRYASSPSMAPSARNPIAPQVPPEPSTIAPRSTATTAVNAPPASTDTNDVSPIRHVQAARLVPHGQRDGAELVGGAHVDAVGLAMLRDGGELQHAGREADRQTALPERLQHAAHAADDRASRPVGGVGQEHQVELLRADVADVRPRQTVAGRSDDEVHGTGRAQDLHQRPGVVAHVGRRIRRVEEQLVAVAAAHIEAQRPGIDADGPRHDGSPSPPVSRSDTPSAAATPARTSCRAAPREPRARARGPR